MNTKPLIFVDLDDTLFQTERHTQVEANFRLASVDKNGNALAFMQPKQQSLIDWLFQTADVIPVTARSVAALKRVNLKFQHAAICAYGGIILDAQQCIDTEWFAWQHQQIAQLQSIMFDLEQHILVYAKEIISLRTWFVEENGVKIYLVVKHHTPNQARYLINWVKSFSPEILTHFYLHLNQSSLAIIPRSISKQNAVEYYLQKHHQHTERVLIGLGDSLADFGFLSCCDWCATPKNSQLHHFTSAALDQHYQHQGFYGYV